MNRALKAFLRAVAAICLWGAPIVGIIGAAAGLSRGLDAARFAAVFVAVGYFVVVGLLFGGVLQLLLSIDDRLERLEANR